MPVNGRITPKTVLGFFWAVLAVVLAASAAAIASMASYEHLTGAIVGILVFDGSVVLVVLIAVFALTLVDPTKLMLAQISGQEYIANRKLTMGDSIAGESRIQPASMTTASADESGENGE